MHDTCWSACRPCAASLTATARRRLNKLGTFSLSQLGQSKSPFAEFMRSQRKSNENFEESLLKLVRTLPTVLKYLPSEKAQVWPLPSSPHCCVPAQVVLRPSGSMCIKQVASAPARQATLMI